MPVAGVFVGYVAIKGIAILIISKLIYKVDL
jgi:hypothetical protein